MLASIMTMRQRPRMHSRYETSLLSRRGSAIVIAASSAASIDNIHALQIAAPDNGHKALCLLSRHGNPGIVLVMVRAY